jgi:hypothetical protein
MKKLYSLKVGEDIVPFEKIDINEDGTAVKEMLNDKIFAYENNPTIVNLFGMKEIPNAGDIYDPTIQGFPFVRKSPSPTDYFGEHGKFAIVVNNLVKFLFVFDLSTEAGYRLNAIFSSNPQFLEPEIVE